MARITRRRIIGGTIGAAGFVAAGRLGRAVAQTGPIRIGSILPISGNRESLARALRIGAEIARDEINKAGGVLGRELQIEFRDDKSSATQGVAVFRELTGDGINLIAGPLDTTVALGLAPLLHEANAISILTGTIADSVTHEFASPNLFRISDNAYIRYRAQAKLMAEHEPKSGKWAGIVPTIEYSQSVWAAFTNGMREFYPSIAKQQVTIYDPISTTPGQPDFKNQIGQLLGMDIDALMITLAGSELINFLGQAHTLGLDKKIKLLADAGSDLIGAKAMGRNLGTSFWTSTHWYYGLYLDTPAGKSLYDAVVARTGDKLPDGFYEPVHAAVHAYALAITAAKTTDTEPVIAALEKIQWDTAKGPRRFRKEDHQVIGDVNILRIAPTAEDPGWKVAEANKIDGGSVIEPPTPGQKIKYG
jgi:branched-chain amino acid transport system substrate-binding protein